MNAETNRATINLCDDYKRMENARAPRWWEIDVRHWFKVERHRALEHSRLESFEAQIEDAAPMFTLILAIAAIASLLIGAWALVNATHDLSK